MRQISKTTSQCAAVALAITLLTGVAVAMAADAHAIPQPPETRPFYMILVDKAKSQIHLGEYAGEQISVLKSHHVTTGKAAGDKEVEKDLKTPEGIYFFTSKLGPPGLKKKFGVMALMMNYPNPIDTRSGKTGYDIMLHATDDPPRLVRDRDSEGCVVVSNEQIVDLARFVRLGLTPIIVYPELKPEYLSSNGMPEVRNAFEGWISAWRNKDLDKYIGSYSDDFSYSGMNLKKYREYKASLNQRYAEINIEARNVRYFFHPKYSAVMFNQIYSSKLKGGGRGFNSSGTKIVYLVKSPAGYKIASEAYTSVKE